MTHCVVFEKLFDVFFMSPLAGGYKIHMAKVEETE